MNRAEFQRLADVRVREAEALLAAGLWDGAYYLAGYAVECELKAAIITRVQTDPGLLFEEKHKNFQRDCWSHSLSSLVKLAGLELQLDNRQQTDPMFQDRWSLVAVKWSEKVRYEFKTESEARLLVAAVNDPSFGVLPWLVSLR